MCAADYRYVIDSIFRDSGLSDIISCDNRGLGFVISPWLLNHINSYKYISDQVSILDFPRNSGLHLKCGVVNAYGPTSERAAEDNFYAKITSVIGIHVRWKFFICDDINSKLRKLIPEDTEDGAHSNVDTYGMETRNSNPINQRPLCKQHSLQTPM